MTYTNPAAYECFMGRWSARLAPLFAAFAGIRSGERVLDVGCGTGILSRALIDLAPNIEVIGIDPAASYVDWACRSLRSPRVRFQVGTAEALAFTDAAFDAALALLVVQELADPPRAVREMARVTRRGGYVAACKWDFGNGLPMLSLFWQAAEAVSPDAVARYRASKGIRPDYPGPDELAALWRDSGLSEVRTVALGITMEFASFEDFWLPFLGGATATSVFARNLNDATQGAVERRLRETLASVFGVGRFALPARAWAVAGIVAN
jgi:ubiquinone/menaquinone biosynthesis C-methylase UbiE